MTTEAHSVSINSPALLRLMQLSSVSLPVGGYAFSQGLEFAVENGWVKNLAETRDWLSLQLAETLTQVDLPILRGAMEAAQNNDSVRWQQWNDLALASRESSELRLTDTAMGEALLRLLKSLSVPLPENIIHRSDISFVALYAWPAVFWQIPFDAAASGLSWSWLENQIAAATKLVPLGQTQAQLLLGELQQDIPRVIAESYAVAEDEIGSTLPALAIASAQHESQYTRLFRS
ncbi:MAG: urease accessory UreF family protein [Oleibacter sp.]|nr:urease accessory UreF family protein [Thalassolituus sp.]